jgi:hypothetical protein
MCKVQKKNNFAKNIFPIMLSATLHSWVILTFVYLRRNFAIADTAQSEDFKWSLYMLVWYVAAV